MSAKLEKRQNAKSQQAPVRVLGKENSLSPTRNGLEANDSTESKYSRSKRIHGQVYGRTHRIKTHLNKYSFVLVVLVVVLVVVMWSAATSRTKVAKKAPTFFLARSIGNALPPRQDKNQSLRNLEFVLLHEPKWPNVQRHWILNRIIDAEVEDRLIQLLESHHESYSRLPFNLTAYSKVPYVFTNHDPGDNDVIHTDKFALKLKEKDRLILLDATQDQKSLYATNVNGARNFMIEYGLNQTTKPEYIMPWDGNCFLTSEAYNQVVRAVLKNPRDLYFITPMDRVKGSNDVLLNPTYKPNPIEEPQIIFHRSAKGRFDPNLRYGRRNKVELLIRLGVPGKWTNWKWESWEERYRHPQRVPDVKSDIKRAGWVARLFSGNARLEQKDQLVQRGVARSESLTRLFHTLDLRAATELHGWSRDTYMFYDRNVLEMERKDEGTLKLRRELTALADEALKHGPWSVVDKKSYGCGVSDNCHDYYHPSPYFWPQMSNGVPDLEKPFKKRDGIRLPGTVLYSKESDEFDRTRLAAMQFNTTILALAYSMTGEKTYARKAADNIKTWFVNPETRMTPHLNCAQIRWYGSQKRSLNVGTPSGLIEMKDLYFFLDAVRMVEEAGELNESDKRSLREWFREYLEWMIAAEQAQKEFRQPNNHGLYFDIQLIAVASYTGNLTLALETIHQSASRLEAHIASNGRMPHEMKRPTCEHYQMFTLQGWTTLARMAGRVGVDLWDKVKLLTECIDDGSLRFRLCQISSKLGLGLLRNYQSGLCRAMEFSVPFLRERQPCPGNSQAEDDKRWWPLVLEAHEHCPNLTIVKGSSVTPKWLSHGSTPLPASQYEMSSRYFEHDGVAPFWNLGRFRVA